MNEQETLNMGSMLHQVERNRRQTPHRRGADPDAGDLASERGPVARRILIADDDAAVREMLGRVLRSEGYAVLFARNGQEAAGRFMDDPPDLVLLDLNMPERDGWEAFSLMCGEDPMVPVIIITARPHEYSKALELGVDALMEKPLDLPLLLDSIRELLAESREERTRRLTNPRFRTALLDRQPRACVIGATS